jgi:hypothetical protein
MAFDFYARDGNRIPDDVVLFAVYMFGKLQYIKLKVRSRIPMGEVKLILKKPHLLIPRLTKLRVTQVMLIAEFIEGGGIDDLPVHCYVIRGDHNSGWRLCNPGTDLDVCLYSEQAKQTLANCREMTLCRLELTG